MVLDPRGSLEVTEGQVEDCQKDAAEMTSAEQTEGEMESNSSREGSDQSESEERGFINSLYTFMKERGTAIERIPHLGFKQINLWKIYKTVETFGGYEAVTSQRLWKNVYDELGGSPGSTSAATCTRRHYERLVLPFERRMRGEEDKPLPPSKPRKQYKRSPEAGENKPEIKKRRKTEREENEHQTASGHLRDQGASSHQSSWLASRDCQDSPGITIRENTLLQMPTPNQVISPLEKKKRLAQASLSLPPIGPLDDATESERPSVIQLSHLSQSHWPSLDLRNQTSDGSPLPLSSPSVSLSRTPSPLSVSSEECVAVPIQKTLTEETKNKGHYCSPSLSTSKDHSTGVCKPLGCYPSRKDLRHYPHNHYGELSEAGTHGKGQRSPSEFIPGDKSSFRLASQGLPNLTKPCWVPHVSSFYKVSPRDAYRPVPTFKPLMPYQHLLLKRQTTNYSYVQKMPVCSTLHSTDRKEKAKTVVPKPLPTQRFLVHPHASLTMPCLPAKDRAQGDMSVNQLKVLPMHPVLLSIPPTQTHSLPCPIVGTRYPGSYEAALSSYSYPLPTWHQSAGYHMADLQPY
ncbi:hypothetical protein DNTS_031005 [Danionella cerebrum]|uniref:ARID domain-containing protein n=1 Tax=Danionella cerebrum TaxID=2873325 RepID=A0A553PV97_9TELE|nr:hypothetical protein DNTS_031005 [Danionella translucida]